MIKLHPYVSLYTATIYDYLDKYSHIISGLRNTRDRLFGTKSL
ncbi:hypothetical protein [Nostoc sp. UHCC 0252]|nr:hypothetical protein [Nostoc sp. UHCC 0252]MEA5600989.1 hypothetical protein [Nostoc sp. UHCC 0252]